MNQTRKTQADYVYECLVDTKRPMTTREIVDWICINYHDYANDKFLNCKQEKYTTLEQYKEQIAAEIGSNTQSILKKFPELVIVSEKPRVWSVQSSISTINSDNTPKKNVKFNEHALYPKLSEFLKQLHTNVYSKRIDERKSSNKEGKNANRWTHPDLVGLEVLDTDYDDTIKQIISHMNDRKINLWSFEVKIAINLSNVREIFFQAVSNSSWSNYGYVAASEITSEALKEFRMLSQTHKIGLIILDYNDVDNSEIKIPATLKDDIDWNMINKLYRNNPDFKEFIKLIKEYHLTGNIKEYEWD